MSNIKVVVQDANNVLLEVTPVPIQQIAIDRGVAGRGVEDVTAIEIDNALYLEFTFTDGSTEIVGPVGTIQYIGQSPVVVTGSTISLSTVPINLGGTGQTTANASFNALAPTQTGNAGKYLTTDGSNTSWQSNPLGTVTSVDMSVPTGLTVSGNPITTSGTLAVGLQSGYSIPTTANQTNWDTAYSERQQWDGGATNLVAATGRTSLGLGTIATQNANSVSITGGSITGITDLAIADGGTGASTAADARTNLGLGTSAVLNAGVALGVATLDAGGTVPLSQIPASIQGGVSYQGAWNALTNTPSLTSSVGTKGYYYVVSVAGNTNLNGVTDWLVGDWAIFNGSIWQKIDNTDSVASVNGYTGVVVLGASDVGAPPTSLTISTGTGLSGGGDLSANRTLSIADTAVTANSYGSASSVGTFTVNAQGQLTAASNTSIAISNTQVSGLGTMSTQNASDVTITGGSISGITDLAIVDGGTGASTAGAALSNLGGIGTITSLDGSIVVLASGTSVDLAVSAASPASTLLAQVRNTTGATLTKGTVVYISGATGQISTVSKAIASGDSTSAQTLGMITADLANNTNGYVTVFGLITNINTSAYEDGDQLYLSGTVAGGVTTTKPSAPTHLVYVAVVEYAHPTQGKLLVKVQNGYELDEIHDVAISSPVTGQTLTYNSTTDLWSNTTVSLTAGVNGTLPIANGGTGQTTANAAFNALAPSQTGNSGKYLTTDGTDTSWASNPLGTVTSVAASVPSFLSVSGSPITTSGTLDFTLSGTALPTTSGGTGLTSFTANGVAYASSTSALATGSALQFDGNTLAVTTGVTPISLDRTGTGTALIELKQSGTTGSYIGTTGGNDLIIYNGSASELARFNNTGLGIGTNSPASRLDVANSATPVVFSMTLTGAQRWQQIIDTTYGNWTLKDQTAGIDVLVASASSGNLGLGVTPSAWGTTFKALQIGSSYGAIEGNASGISMSGNVYYSSYGWQTINTGASTLYSQFAGSHVWYNAASVSANDFPTFTQAMTLDASGNLGIGTSSPNAKLDLFNTSRIKFNVTSTTNAIEYWKDETPSFAASTGTGTATGIASAYKVDIFDGSAWATATTIDSSGNLGLGVTPSAWGSTYKVIQLPSSTYGGGSFFTDAGSPAIAGNAYNNAGWKYVNNDFATIYQSRSGQHQWYTAPSGTVGDAISFTQAMTLDANGNLGIGTSYPSANLHVQSTQASMNLRSTGTGNPYIDFYTSTSSLVGNIYGIDGGGIALGTTSGTERMRLNSTGNLGLGVVPYSSWDGNSKVIELGGNLFSIFAANLRHLSLANTVFDGIDFRYLNSYPALQYRMSAGSGAHEWYTAPSGSGGNVISFTQAMTLDNNGNLMLGTTSDLLAGANRVTISVNGTGSSGLAFGVANSRTGHIYSDTSELAIANGNGSNGFITLQTNGAEQARIDSSGNFGLGVTPSAWRSTWKALQIGARASFISGTVGQPIISYNAYQNTSSQWIYLANEKASNYEQSDGIHYWYTAPTGTAGNAITFTQAMTLDASGNLGIGTSSPAVKLDVIGAVKATIASTASNNIRVGNSGSNFYFATENSAGGSFCVGSLAYSGLLVSDNAIQLSTTNGGSVQATIDTSGNLGLGVTPSASNACTNIELPYGATLSARSNTAAPQFAMMSNAVGNWYEATYKINGFATQYTQQGFDGAHKWYTAPSGTAGNAITFTQAMTLSASSELNIDSGTGGGRLTFTPGSSSNNLLSTTTGFSAYNALRVIASDIRFETGSSPTERARISSAGYFGIGTSSPIVGFQSYAGTGTTGWNWFAGNATNPPAGCTYGALLSTNLSQGNSETNLVWGQGIGAGQYFAIGKWTGSAYTEQMRIDSSGNLLVGCTATPSASVKGAGLIKDTTGTDLYLSSSDTATDRVIWFYNPNGLIGGVTVSGSTTAYNTSSDQRLKENIQDADSASALIDSLQVRKFDWKADGSHQRYGFVAQELVTVAPEAVHQPEDTEEMMAVDYSKLVPMLVKEIQSLRKRLADAGL